jgi:hypothetical protein
MNHILIPILFLKALANTVHIVILTGGANIMAQVFIYRLTAQDMLDAMNHLLAERRESLMKQNR